MIKNLPIALTLARVNENVLKAVHNVIRHFVNVIVVLSALIILPVRNEFYQLLIRLKLLKKIASIFVLKKKSREQF